MYELIAIRQRQPHLRGKGRGDSSTKTTFYYYSSWLPLISPGVYQLAQILINSIKYLQTCFSIHYILVSLQPRAIPEFVYKCQVRVHELCISQRGITLTEKKIKQHESLNRSTYLETADSLLIYEFQQHFYYGEIHIQCSQGLGSIRDM